MLLATATSNISAAPLHHRWPFESSTYYLLFHNPFGSPHHRYNSHAGNGIFHGKNWLFIEMTYCRNKIGKKFCGACILIKLFCILDCTVERKFSLCWSTTLNDCQNIIPTLYAKKRTAIMGADGRADGGTARNGMQERAESRPSRLLPCTMDTPRDRNFGCACHASIFGVIPHRLWPHKNDGHDCHHHGVLFSLMITFRQQSSIALNNHDSLRLWMLLEYPWFATSHMRGMFVSSTQFITRINTAINMAFKVLTQQRFSSILRCHLTHLTLLDVVRWLRFYCSGWLMNKCPYQWFWDAFWAVKRDKQG